MKKRCRVCENNLDLSKFEESRIKRKDWICRDCRSNTAKKIRKQIIAEHGGKCKHCGTGDVIRGVGGLHFHHIDPKTKVHTVSDMIRWRQPIESIREEANKCILLCSPCHIEEHRK